MVTVELILETLVKRKAEYAEAALTTPAGKEAFDYGRASGTYLGLAQAVAEIETLLATDAEKERIEESRK